MRELKRRFSFAGASRFREVYDYVTSAVECSEQSERFTYTCQPVKVVDPDSVGLEVSVWETETERPNDWLVHNAYVAEIRIDQERAGGEITGTLYIETDPACWHRPEDAPWRHQRKREKPWGVPKMTGTRFVLELWRKLVEDWQKRSEPPTAEESAGTKSGGRPRNPDDDWAYREIKSGREQTEIYREWLKRIPEERKTQLADVSDSFKKAMRYRRNKEKRE